MLLCYVSITLISHQKLCWATLCGSDIKLKGLIVHLKLVKHIASAPLTVSRRLIFYAFSMFVALKFLVCV